MGSDACGRAMGIREFRPQDLCTMSFASNLLDLSAVPVMDHMSALGLSTLVVATAEIGDKTQLLALVLAARWRKPVPILLGILSATLLNHALAAGLGVFAGDILKGEWMRWVLGIAFLGFAGWALIPDTLDEDEAPKVGGKYGVFVSTLIAFFLVEMGDKTQVATVALGARFHDLVFVTLGTTLGMMLANGPVVFAGDAITKKLPILWIQRGAAALFALIGLYVLIFG